jgi:phosphatidate cytidylyltransferase
MNSIAANGDTARPVARSAFRPLQLRILSGLVLAPLAVAAVLAGTPAFAVLLAVAGLAMAWEWARICSAGRFGKAGYIFAAAVLLAVAAAVWQRYELGLAIIATGAVAGYLTARPMPGTSAPWLVIGTVIVALALVALVWLHDVAGPAIVLWLLGAVWATDIGAFFTGRKFGGPLLAAAISPGKTWSGLAGGMVCAGLWSLGWGWWMEVHSMVMLGLAGAIAAVVAQAGDLGVSMVKRRFSVKDASNLIPGHGGVLDRVDGFLTTAPVLAGLLLTARGGGMSWL